MSLNAVFMRKSRMSQSVTRFDIIAGAAGRYGDSYAAIDRTVISSRSQDIFA